MQMIKTRVQIHHCLCILSYFLQGIQWRARTSAVTMLQCRDITRAVLLAHRDLDDRLRTAVRGA